MGITTCDGSEPLVSSGFFANTRLGITTAATGASLRFTERDGTNQANAELVHRMTTAFLEWRPGRRWSVAFAAGALLGGWVDLAWPGRRESLRLAPGLLTALSGSYLASREGAFAPFVLTGLSLGAGFERAIAEPHPEAAGQQAAEPFTAVDLRLSVTVGKTFAERLRPYASVRTFGGPIVLGSRALGTDRYHLQAAFGLAVVLPRGFDVFAEAAPGPERAASFGVGFAPGR